MSGRILVVDDNTAILEAIKITLENEGYTVVTAVNYESIARQLGMYRPNLIILDVLLDGVDGRDICRRLKSDSETKSIPVIMISALSSVQESVITSGADDFIAKPFDIDDFLYIVKSRLQ